MAKFGIIDHTADVGIVAYGSSVEEVFINAAYGMFSIIADLRTVKATESRSLELKEDGYEALLFEWLNRLIYFFDAEMLLLRRFDIINLEGSQLTAVCYGERYDSSRHHLKTGVKAATYHMLKVDEEKNRIQVILDI